MLTITVWPMLPMARMKVVLHHSLPWVLWACCAPQAPPVD